MYKGEMINNSNNGGNQMSMLDFVEFLSSDSDSVSDNEETPTKSSHDEAIADLSSNSDTEAWDKHDNATLAEHAPGKHVTQKEDLKKKETLSAIQQFHTHIVSLEKEMRSLLHSKNRLNGQVYSELEDHLQKCNENREKEKIEIQQNLNKISTKIDKFKRDKEDVRKCTSNLEKLKLLMEDIEENVMQFKEKQRMVYEDLMGDEKSLTSDMATFEKKLNMWQQPLDMPVRAKHNQKGNKRDVLMPKEVAEFENYLVMTGGHQGGWDDIDHQTFLRLRKQHKKNDKLLPACVRDIPTQGKEDIEQHIQWHEEYCILRERKREAIRLWKNLKENEREDMLKNVQLDDTADEKKRRKKEELLEKEREERFEKLKEYKEQQQLEEERERKMKDDLDAQIKEKQKFNNMLEEKKRVELKMQLEDYRLKKKEEEEVLKSAHEEKLRQERLIISEEEKNRIRERNEKLIASKQRQKEKEEYELREKEKRLAKLKQQVNVNVERDPSRLFKLTAGWQHRKQDDNKARNSATSGARLMPHRAVPSWRQGMNM